MNTKIKILLTFAIVALLVVSIQSNSVAREKDSLDKQEQRLALNDSKNIVERMFCGIFPTFYRFIKIDVNERAYDLPGIENPGSFYSNREVERKPLIDSRKQDVSQYGPERKLKID